MAITPNTDLRLLKLPFYLNNKHQLTFSNINAQETFFLGLPNLEVDNISYQRKDNTIRYPAHIDSLLQYNYCMYKNENYGNKWFYAYISNMEYSNDGMTIITITTDVWQTWQFDLTFKESFIEREMLSTSDDVPGANLIPEGLETGEVKIAAKSSFDDLSPRYIIAFTGDTFAGSSISQDGFSYNGIFSAVTFIVTNALDYALTSINQAGNGDKILTVFSVPYFAVKDFVNERSSHEYYALPITRDFKQSIITKNLIARPNSIDGYTPRNKKLLTYPYLYLGFNPANGSEKIYRYENFSNATPSFKLISEINPNPSLCFIPQNYRGLSENIADSSTMNGYPTISYKNDVFNTWLAQNSQIVSLNMQQEQFNYEISAFKGGIETASSLVSGGLKQDVGIIGSTANQAFNMISLDKNHELYIKQQMAQIEKQKLLPDTSTLSGSNATLLGYDYMNDNVFCRYNIKEQFARKIDKYFDMYGYLTNERKIPNINNRPNWNYVKTVGCNIIANIPQMDLETIRNMFDNGITLWHNYNNFMNYSANNR